MVIYDFFLIDKHDKQKTGWPVEGPNYSERQPDEQYAMRDVPAVSANHPRRSECSMKHLGKRRGVDVDETGSTVLDYVGL